MTDSGVTVEDSLSPTGWRDEAGAANKLVVCSGGSDEEFVFRRPAISNIIIKSIAIIQAKDES